MIAIVDYGLGNLRSAQKGLEAAGHSADVTSDPAKIAAAAAVVLPGVGAFKDCYEGLVSRNLVDPVKEAAASGKPFLGICVGMQLLFDSSDENPGTPGLGIFPGKVVRFPASTQPGLKVPHMGWNTLRTVEGHACPLLENRTGEGEPYVYFVHSYYAVPDESEVVLATSHHGVEFTAMVGRGNVFATQFHPEKSQREGIGILRAFGDLAKVAR
jgi:glutamine amidotransferase